MPNKFSHSVILAHYSSLGLIDLPDDQHDRYINSCSPQSRAPSHEGLPSRPPTGRGVPADAAVQSPNQLRQSPSSDRVPAQASSDPKHQHPRSATATRRLIVNSEPDFEDEAVDLSTRSEYSHSSPSTDGWRSQQQLYNSLEKLASARDEWRCSSRDHMSIRNSISRESMPQSASISIPRSSGDTNSPVPSLPIPIYCTGIDSVEVDGYECSDMAQLDDRPAVLELGAEPRRGTKSPSRTRSLKSSQCDPTVQLRSPSSRTGSIITTDTQIYNPRPDELDFEGFSDTNESAADQVPTLVGAGSIWTLGSTQVPFEVTRQALGSAELAGSRRRPGVPVEENGWCHDSSDSLSSLSSIGILSVEPSKSNRRRATTFNPAVGQVRDHQTSQEQRMSIDSAEGEAMSFSPSLFTSIGAPSRNLGRVAVLSPVSGLERDHETDARSVSEASAIFPPDIAKYRKGNETQSPLALINDKLDRLSREEQIRAVEERLKELRRENVSKETLDRRSVGKEKGTGRLIRRLRGMSLGKNERSAILD